MIDLRRLSRRGVVENDPGLARQENRLRGGRTALRFHRLAEQFPVEFGRSRTIPRLDRYVVHSTGMEQDFLLGPGVRRGVPELLPGLVRPKLYARSIRILDKEPQ